MFEGYTYVWRDARRGFWLDVGRGFWLDASHSLVWIPTI